MSDGAPAEDRDRTPINPDELPFVATCRRVDTLAPLNWYRRGWGDLKRAPRQSLGYGLFILLLSYAVAGAAMELGSYVVMLAMLSGFVFVAPVLAIGLYSISRQLQNGLRPRLGYCILEERRHLGNEMVFAMILLVIFLLWARAASMVHVFFPVEAEPKIEDLAVFLLIGSAVGSIFAALVFTASAFSLPMILDVRVDMVTAVLTSVNAVLRNKGAMVVWVLLILGSVALGFATAFLGLAVLIPVIGHATWHGYQEIVDTRGWPRHEPAAG